MSKIGFMIDNIGKNDLAFLLLKVAENTKHEVIIFYENLFAPSIRPQCAILNISECYGFSGRLIATNISTRRKLSKVYGTKDKIFYPWALEYIRYDNFNFNTMYGVYNCPDIELIARSDEYAKLLHNNWGILPRVVKNLGDLCDAR